MKLGTHKNSYFVLVMNEVLCFNVEQLAPVHTWINARVFVVRQTDWDELWPLRTFNENCCGGGREKILAMTFLYFKFWDRTINISHICEALANARREKDMK